MNTIAQEAVNAATPTYGGKPKKSGLYLGLFHGRQEPGEKIPLLNHGFVDQELFGR